MAKTAIESIQKNIYPKCRTICEPQMSKRGLYPTTSVKNTNELSRSYMNFLQYADGYNSLEIISKLIKLDLKLVKKLNFILLKNKLITN